MILDLALPSQLMLALLPDLVLMVGAMALMLQAAWRPDSLARQRTVGINAMGIVILTAVAVVVMAVRDPSATEGVIAVDGFRWMLDLVILLAALATIALSIEHNERESIAQPEMHVLVLFAAAGMMVLTAARDLMIIFLGIEMMSVAAYILTGMNRRSPRAAEASLKYFLLGAFATGFLLYGIALVYGATGATQLHVIGDRIASAEMRTDPMLLAGIGLLTVGLGFKIAAVPFHMWAPDVYDGAPSPLSAFMMAAVKTATFATFVRIWYESFIFTFRAWAPVLVWLAIATMVVGNVIALSQKNIKRMLGYSSIVHAGYLLVAVLAFSPMASASLIFYAVAYTLATFGAFAVVVTVHGSEERAPLLTDYAGLWQTRPWLAVGMTICLLSLLGFPIFGGVGFFAKWYLLQATLTSPFNLKLVAVLIVLTSVISAGYYLQVVRLMFMQPPAAGAAPTPPTGPLTRLVLVGTVVAILAFGVIPGSLLDLSRSGAKQPYVGTRQAPAVRMNTVTP